MTNATSSFLFGGFAKNVLQCCLLNDVDEYVCTHFLSNLLSSLSLGILDWYYSINIKDHIDQPTCYSFSYDHSHQRIWSLRKSPMASSEPLDHGHSVNHTCWWLYCGIASAAGTSFWSSLANVDLLVFLREPLVLANAQGRGPNWWESTGLIENFLVSALTIIWANTALSALKITSLDDPCLLHSCSKTYQSSQKTFLPGICFYLGWGYLNIGSPRRSTALSSIVDSDIIVVHYFYASLFGFCNCEGLLYRMKVRPYCRHVWQCRLLCATYPRLRGSLLIYRCFPRRATY